MAEGRHRSSRRKPAIIVISSVMAIGLAVGAFLLFGGSETVRRILPGIDEPDMTVPEFDFRVTKSTAIATTDAEEKELAGAAKDAAADATKTLDELFTEAFLDPANWREGSYDEVWSLFDGGASSAAQKDGEALTLGATAGETYDAVSPAKSKIQFRVLMDGEDQPDTIVAIVHFRAKAHVEDGPTTIVVSTGQFFLHRDGGHWTVFSYKLSRTDELREPQPEPTTSPGSATPTESPS